MIEINPAQGSEFLIRVEFLEMKSIGLRRLDPLNGQVQNTLEHVIIFPASHYVVPQEQINKACDEIEKGAGGQNTLFQRKDKLLEAQRISERTNFRY